MLRTRSHAGLALIAALLLPLPAEAHLGGLGAGDFWLGFLHPLATLEDALAFLALGILAGQSGEENGLRTLGYFSLTLAIGAVLAYFNVAGSWVALSNLASLMVLGGLVALAWKLPLAISIALGMLCGLTHGAANGTEMVAPIKPWLFVPGLALAGFITTFYIMLGVIRLKPWWTQIALRVIGSWIAAVGLLMLALQSISRTAA